MSAVKDNTEMSFSFQTDVPTYVLPIPVYITVALRIRGITMTGVKANCYSNL